MCKNRAGTQLQAATYSHTSLNERMDAQVQKRKGEVVSFTAPLMCGHSSPGCRVFPHGDTFVQTLLTNLSAALFVCVSVFANVLKKVFAFASPMKEKFVFEHVPHTHTHMHTYVLDLEQEGYGEVRRGKAICKSICCVKINFLLRDFESHNSLAFPGRFPSDTCS